MISLLIKILILTFSIFTYAGSTTPSFCKKTSLKTAKQILKSQGESISSVDVVKQSSTAVSGENYNEESFDLRLKTKKSEVCVTMKYFSSKNSCVLTAYQYPGCH